MAISMTNRTMLFVLGALFIIPVAGTLYRLVEVIIEGHWSFRFNPEFVDRLPLFIYGVTMLIFFGFGRDAISAAHPPKGSKVASCSGAFGRNGGGSRRPKRRLDDPSP